MKLKSEPWASHLSDPRDRYTLKEYCRLQELPYAHGVPTPVETFVDYGRWFQQQAVPDLHETDVVRVDREGDSDHLYPHRRGIVPQSGVRQPVSGFMTCCPSGEPGFYGYSWRAT